jgi:hypothetical protein
MVGATTYYSRILALLELTGSRSFRTAGDLIKSVITRSPPNFVYHRWNQEKNQIEGMCSESAVEKTFELAVDLGLLDRESGAPTATGKEAADPGRYNVILRRQVSAYLKRLGCPIDEIERTSLRLIRATKTTLPTVDTLFEVICRGNEIEVSEKRFGVLLRLLAACGGIQIVRRYIFLPVN